MSVSGTSYVQRLCRDEERDCRYSRGVVRFLIEDNSLEKWLLHRCIVGQVQSWFDEVIF